MKQITSLQHPLVKHFVRLRKSRSYRKESGTCLVEGVKMVKEVKGEVVMATERHDFPGAILVSDAVMKKVSGALSPEGIVAEVAMPEMASLVEKEKIVVLDAVADPGNVGTLIRTALALGWDGIFITEDSCDPFNDKALRSAKGATFRLPMQVGDRGSLMKLLEEGGFKGLVADMGGDKPQKVEGKIALMLGNEAQGFSEEVLSSFETVAVPMSGDMESLNVAVAGGVLMYALGGPA